MPIRSFKDRDTERLFEGARVPRFQAIADQAERRLKLLDVARTLMVLRALRSNRFEALGGDRKGVYSLRINDQWRVCFAWRLTEASDGRDVLLVPGDAWDVEIIDYH